jgi:phospholipid/cholesterol/gamma-HCH transport system ATP-binding protein
MSDARPHIEVRGLTMGFGARVVQQDLDFEIGRGEIFVIMGDSGSGKSTLMRHMIGLNRPARGDVLYDGQPLWAADEEAREAFKARSGAR